MWWGEGVTFTDRETEGGGRAQCCQIVLMMMMMMI